MTTGKITLTLSRELNEKKKGRNISASFVFADPFDDKNFKKKFLEGDTEWYTQILTDLVTKIIQDVEK